MSDLKICYRCRETKETKDFYLCSGKLRSECKECTKKRNMSYEKKVKSTKQRIEDNDSRKHYMRVYYSLNKEKFAKYREEFREKYPNYYNDYYVKRKEKKEVSSKNYPPNTNKLNTELN